MLRKPLLVVAAVIAFVIGGTAGAYAGTSLETTPMYRFYNFRIGSHFFTSDATERDTIIATLGNTYQYEGVAYTIAVPGQVSTYVGDCVSALQAQVDSLALRTTAAEADIASLEARADALEGGGLGAPYRWAVFSTYSVTSGWYSSNDPALYGGVAPSNWSDNAATASQLSADKNVLRSLFANKGYAGANAHVWSEEWYCMSSTQSRHALALFRVRNTTNAPINWNVDPYMTANAGWNEVRSIAINGQSVPVSNGNYPAANCLLSVDITVPANRTSTVVFAASSGPQFVYNGHGIRDLLLAFSGNCLDLPDGLEFVDDFDTATGGWDQ